MKFPAKYIPAPVSNNETIAEHTNNEMLTPNHAQQFIRTTDYYLVVCEQLRIETKMWNLVTN